MFLHDSVNHNQSLIQNQNELILMTDPKSEASKKRQLFYLISQHLGNFTLIRDTNISFIPYVLLTPRALEIPVFQCHF